MKFEKSLILLIILSLIPSSLHAEVIDKIPSVASILLWGAALGIAGFFLCRIKPWLGITSFLFTLFLALSFQTEIINDLSIKRAVLREVGYSYLAVNYSALFISLIGHGLGIWIWKKKKE